MDIVELFHCDSNINLFEKALAYLKFPNNCNDKNNSIEQFIVTEINKKFEKDATHHQSLNLLLKFALKFSKENLTKYFSHWNSKITQILTNANKDSQVLTLVCRTIGVFFISCKQIPELDKQVSIFNIKHVMGVIVELYCERKNVAVLNLIKLLLYYYPESCARFQTSISKVISLCIDDQEVYSVAGAKCYALLVRAIERSFVNSLKNDTVDLPDNNSARCHISHQMSLSNHLCSILDELFQDLIISSGLGDGLPESISDSILHLSKIPCINISVYYSALERRFSNISLYLCTLLKCGCAGGKKFVLPNIILQVIHKGLTITPENLEKNNDNKQILLLILPKIYIALLNILNTLIISLGNELLPYALTIQQLILQTLSSIQSSDNSFINARILAYKSLSIWLKTLGSLSGFQRLADEFLNCILKDFSSSKRRSIILTTKVSKKSTKANLNHQKSKGTVNSTDFNNCNDTTTALHIQILTTIQSIITSTNYYLKQSFYNSVTEIIVSSLYEHCTRHNSFSSNKIAGEWKIQLLRTLRILQLHTHSLQPSPISYAIHILGMTLSRNTNSEIIEEANFGLAELSHTINPATPTLVVPLLKQLNPHSSLRSPSPETNETITSSLKRKQILVNDDEIPSKSVKQLT